MPRHAPAQALISKAVIGSPLWATLAILAAMFFLLRARWSARLSAWAARKTPANWLRPALYAVPFMICWTLLTLPWAIYSGFVRERHYGLMNLSFADWLFEQTISLVLTTIVAVILSVTVFALIWRAPRKWWLWAAAATSLVAGAALVAEPVFVDPLFNEYESMPPGPLRDQIPTMARANHIPAKDVYTLDASKQSDRISANVSGLGPTVRISLNDNLLKFASPAEVKAVMGHEMGHYVLGHALDEWLFLTVLIFGGFALSSWLLPTALSRLGNRWGVREMSDIAVTPLFVSLGATLFPLLLPILNNASRIEEAQADAFGLNAAREPDGFAAIAMRLSQYRKIDPSPIGELLFFDHPSGRERVHRAMLWKATHEQRVENSDTNGFTRSVASGLCSTRDARGAAEQGNLLSSAHYPR